mmetsp:Transcript_17342/g.43164  ORF Transcript_17342/g.43164 Transcript_17342/m.43164 type:complete len:210 (+) Transcript_17342:961-1590(+)
MLSFFTFDSFCDSNTSSRCRLRAFCAHSLAASVVTEWEGIALGAVFGVVAVLGGDAAAPVLLLELDESVRSLPARFAMASTTASCIADSKFFSFRLSRSTLGETFAASIPTSASAVSPHFGEANNHVSTAASLSSFSSLLPPDNNPPIQDATPPLVDPLQAALSAKTFAGCAYRDKRSRGSTSSSSGMRIFGSTFSHRRVPFDLLMSRQ